MSRAGWLLLLVTLAIPATGRAQISPGPLARAHQELEGATKCAQCHGATKDAMPRLCLSCHKEVTLLVSRGRGYHAKEAKTSGKSCASCHPDHAGRDFAMIAWPAGGKDRFDHRAAGWPLEGKHAPLTCVKCHVTTYRTGPAALISPRKGSAGWMGLETDCASCHVRDDPHRKSLGAKCEDCHTDTDWAPAPRFRHDESRYPLTGKHEQLDCNTCHLAPRLRIAPDAQGKRVPLYRPLEYAECSSCHVDPHKGRLSPKCSECHVTEGFEVRDRRGFNHSLTRYPLLGKHRQASCESCHGRAMATPRPVAATCASCHADRHAGESTRDGAAVDCASCHRVEGFAPSTYTVLQHRGARYALGGKHQRVPCAGCHTTSRASATKPAIIQLRPPFATCAACHVDAHGNQLTGTTCEQCHSDLGWKDIRYDRDEHSRTRLPLEGRHAAVACGACHGSNRPGLPPIAPGADAGTAGMHFHLKEVQCAACHADPHQTPGALKPRDTTTTCGDCHSAVSFRPATVDVASHARFRFPLEGAHRAIPCRECHTALASAPIALGRGATLVGAATRQPHVSLDVSTGATCAGCHVTPHGAQFVARADSGRCDACHGSDRFVGAERFDHERQARFSLKGAHATVSCDKCHRTEVVGGTRRVVYRPVATTCESCHAAPVRGGGP